MSPRWCGSCTAASGKGWQYNCHPNMDARERKEARPLMGTKIRSHLADDHETTQPSRPLGGSRNSVV